MIERQLNFYGANSPWWLALSVAAVAAALVLIVMLLRYERRLVPARVGNSLLLLRLLVLAAALLTLLEPVLTWEIDRKKRGRILVAVDLSESMNTADKHGSRAEKLRWARALGMIGNQATNARIDGWIASLEADEEPLWAGEDEIADPQEREQLAASRKETVQRIFQEIDRLPRKEIIRRLLSQGTSPLIAQLENVAEVDLRVFAGASEASDAQTLDAYLQKPPDVVSTMASNLESALTGVAETDDAHVAGVVLLTDGRDTSGGDPIAKAIQLRDRETPVFPVLIGSEEQPRDLAIASLDYPSRVFKDDHAVLKATFNTTGFGGQEVAVVLEREGHEPITKTMTPSGESHALEFELDAQTVGRGTYTLKADVQAGETREDNNQRVFHTNVVNDTAQVVLLEGAARWEFRFIDNALMRDLRADVSQVVFEQPYLGVQPETFFKRTLVLPDDLQNLKDSPFAEADVVILGDVAPEDFSERSWMLLEQFVAESGGTLVMIAGKRHFPRDHRLEIVERMLPVTNLRVQREDEPSARRAPTERGFGLKLSPEGEALAMLQLDADPLENKRIWDELPGHLWGLIGEAKPAATVFAHAVLPGTDDSLETERKNAVFVHQHYGFGQVLWLGIDSTWRWRHRVGDQYHHRFWGQLARWAADNKAAAGNEFVKFGTDESDIEAGEDVFVRARWTSSFLRQHPDLKASVEVYAFEDGQRSAKPISTLPLEAIETRPVIHEGRIASPRPGEYVVKLLVERADLGPEEIASSFYVHAKKNAELSDLSSNRTLLTRIAEASGGRLFLPDELDELSAMFVSTEDQTALRQETAVWDHWGILLVFFVILTTEWVIRKLNGLP